MSVERNLITYKRNNNTFKRKSVMPFNCHNSLIIMPSGLKLYFFIAALYIFISIRIVELIIISILRDWIPSKKIVTSLILHGQLKWPQKFHPDFCFVFFVGRCGSNQHNWVWEAVCYNGSDGYQNEDEPHPFRNSFFFYLFITPVVENEDFFPPIIFTFFRESSWSTPFFFYIEEGHSRRHVEAQSPQLIWM